MVDRAKRARALLAKQLEYERFEKICRVFWLLAMLGAATFYVMAILSHEVWYYTVVVGWLIASLVFLYYKNHFHGRASDFRQLGICNRIETLVFKDGVWQTDLDESCIVEVKIIKEKEE